MKCGNQVAVGGATPVMRAITSVATTTAEIVCAACTGGSFPSSATGACTPCTPVAGSKAGTYRNLHHCLGQPDWVRLTFPLLLNSLDYWHQFLL